MCGIMAYVGQRNAVPILLEGLARLDYRGYDSAGLATLDGPALHLRKCVGRVTDLTRLLTKRPAPGCLGIAHTRWATHGPATETNAHPHLGGADRVALVHNGVIENHAELRQRLQAEGVVFQSDTDSEVVAQLVATFLDQDLVGAVARVLPQLRGHYALALCSPADPDLLIGVCRGCPLVLGIAGQEKFLASDPAALAGLAELVAFPEDGQLCLLRSGSWQVLGPHGAMAVNLHPAELPPDANDRCGFPHFMLKEVYEQPEVLENVLAGRLDETAGTVRLGALGPDDEGLRQVRRLVLTGCGSSYHAALVGEYLIEEFARLPVEVEYASEFRYRNPPLGRHTALVALSQSGETADTLAALREAQRRGLPTLALCNVAGSSLTREADRTVALRAGPEIGVASTKAFTAQLAALALLALFLGRLHQLPRSRGRQLIRQLYAVPDVLRAALAGDDDVARLARRYGRARHFLFLGRHALFPVALEGALKLKEVSYLPAQGYPAAEMKHGPLAVVDADTPSVFLVPRGAARAKVLANLEEVKARGGPVIAVAGEGDEEVMSRADDVIFMPNVPEWLQPLVAVVPLQLLAYHVALLRNCDVDRPRHLAKSVTVE